MDPITGAALIMGGGSILSSAANVLGAKKQMDFQERMSSTAHQREVKDLRAAGLNPVLSAMKGSGAATPPGARPDIRNPAENLAQVMTTRKMNQAQILTETTKQAANSAAASNSIANAELSNERAVAVASEIDKNIATSRLNNAQARAKKFDAELGQLKGAPLELLNNAIIPKMKKIPALIKQRTGKKNIPTRKRAKKQFDAWRKKQLKNKSSK